MFAVQNYCMSRLVACAFQGLRGEMALEMGCQLQVLVLVKDKKILESYI